jgi:transposase InsO family protein
MRKRKHGVGAIKRALTSLTAGRKFMSEGRTIWELLLQQFTNGSILKTEMFYFNSFHSEQDLRVVIDNHIDFYNNGRFQENLNGMTPIEFRNQPLAA